MHRYRQTDITDHAFSGFLIDLVPFTQGKNMLQGECNGPTCHFDQYYDLNHEIYDADEFKREIHAYRSKLRGNQK